MNGGLYLELIYSGYIGAMNMASMKVLKQKLMHQKEALSEDQIRNFVRTGKEWVVNTKSCYPIHLRCSADNFGYSSFNGSFSFLVYLIFSFTRFAH